ncbi:hypothetical protein PI125_g23587 [Phytophthora idaei]|nr:hypothetical protein PI125_g23587 [Phytophthora idaei]
MTLATTGGTEVAPTMGQTGKDESSKKKKKRR